MVPITVGLHVHRDTDGECRDRSPSQPARPTCGARGVLASRTASSSAVNRPTWPRVAVELAPAEQRIMCCWISPFNSKRSHFFNFPNVSPKLNHGTVKIVTLICLPRQKKTIPLRKIIYLVLLTFSLTCVGLEWAQTKFSVKNETSLSLYSINSDTNKMHASCRCWSVYTTTN